MITSTMGLTGRKYFIIIIVVQSCGKHYASMCEARRVQALTAVPPTYHEHPSVPFIELPAPMESISGEPICQFVKSQ